MGAGGPFEGRESESIETLLACATSREVVSPGDARSGSTFERVIIDGNRYFLKRASPGSDWITRLLGNSSHHSLVAWQAGLLAQVPPSIDHTLVAIEVDGAGADAVLSILMRDVGEHLIPEGDAPISAHQHGRFMAAMAELSAAFWGWRDEVGLIAMTNRLLCFSPETIGPELLAAQVPGPIAAAAEGWQALAKRCPRLFSVARAVHRRPEVLLSALDEGPGTFLHGDWKMGNLGVHPDGRVILVDWSPGAGSPCWDLFWYLALNRARLPEEKEAAVARLRGELESRGIETAAWWEKSTDLCAVGVMSTFGWEKALGDDVELAWWDERVAAACSRLGLQTL